LICYFAWQEQISIGAANTEEPGVVGHDALGLDAMGIDIEEPDALELDSMESDKEPDARESDTGPEVLCRNLLVWTLLS
jgi:hypothetical protein